jgi:glyoxylase-like metal-dependent hydrolase (beta-lactamase superfamily II)
VDEIAAANGVTNRVTHLVYSHHHADHAGAPRCSAGTWSASGTRRPGRLCSALTTQAGPAPEVTFADATPSRWAASGSSWPGTVPNHSPDNIYIHFPATTP